MKKSDAISLHAKPGNWQRFPVMVWEEGKELVTQVDGTVYRAANMFKLDSALDAGGVPAQRNLYYVDEPDYEDHDLPANAGINRRGCMNVEQMTELLSSLSWYDASAYHSANVERILKQAFPNTDFTEQLRDFVECKTMPLGKGCPP